MANTLDATEQGVQLSGVAGDLKVGDVLELHYRDKRAWFRVIWIREAEKEADRHFGTVCIETDKNIWMLDFPNNPDEYEEQE